MDKVNLRWIFSHAVMWAVDGWSLIPFVELRDVTCVHRLSQRLQSQMKAGRSCLTDACFVLLSGAQQIPQCHRPCQESDTEHYENRVCWLSCLTHVSWPVLLASPANPFGLSIAGLSGGLWFLALSVSIPLAVYGSFSQRPFCSATVASHSCEGQIVQAF